MHTPHHKSTLRAIAFMALLPLVGQNLSAQPTICRVSDPTTGSTHTLASGGLKMGISTKGGGYITALTIPGIGAVMDPNVLDYGRGGQTDIRDFRHRVGLNPPGNRAPDGVGRYNPTAGGFFFNGGTVCTINVFPKRLILPKRACALWYGDEKYYFSCNENLAVDNNPDPGRKDDDLVSDDTEKAYQGKQATEITSEWDISQVYEDKMGEVGGYAYGNSRTINIPAIRHYFQYDFARDPMGQDAPMKQFFNDRTVTVSDISNTNPDQQVHVGGDFDMGVLLQEFTWRFQKSIWVPKFCFAVKASQNENTLTATPVVPGEDIYCVTHNDETLKSRVRGFNFWFNNTEADVLYSPLVILTDSSNPESPGALGIFFPPSGNNNLIAGVKGTTTTYTDNRRMQTRFMLQNNGGAIMMGFQHLLTGLLRPKKNNSLYDFESLRGEVYFLSGSPREIYINAQRIEKFNR